MPSEILVTGQKFLAKLNNGDNYDIDINTDFSTHLKGGVLEEVKAIFNVQVSWYSTINPNTSVIYIDKVDFTVRLQVDGKDFSSDGFSVGDTYQFASNSWWVSGVVLAISDGEILLSYNDEGGTFSAGFQRPTQRRFLTGTTLKTALKYDFGLIENNESINFLSKLTNTNQTYLFEGINHGNPLTFVSGLTQGNNKAAYTGEAKVAFVKYVMNKDETDWTGVDYLTTQEFQIEHTFKINPFYRDGELDSLKDIDKPPLDLFNGDMSLKYVFQSEFRTVLNNPNTSMISVYDTQLGSVGYFGESFNGFKSNYSVDNLVYTVGGNVVDRIEIGAVTSVSFDLIATNLKLRAVTPIIVGHTAIVNSLDYAFNSKEYQEVWTDEDLRTLPDLTPINGTLIKNYEATYQGFSLINVSFDIEFTPSQVSVLEDNQDYALYFITHDQNENVDTGDKVTGLIDVNYYFKNSDVAGLHDFDTFEQYPHPYEFDQGVSTGFTNAKTFNESGMMADGRFWILNTANLNSLNFAITLEKFDDLTRTDLRNLSIDLSSQVSVNGIQQIELDSTRGYDLKDGDIFNYLKITTDNNDGTKQYYNIQVGYKIPFQSWLELQNAPTDFYDTAKSLNGLNQKSSNYSLNPSALGYGIKVLFDALVDSTQYIKTSEEIKVYNYDTDDVNNDSYSCEINTFDTNGNQLAKNIINNEYTEVRAIFTPLNPPVFTVSLDFTFVAENWRKYAHGNAYVNLNGRGRLGTWINLQANNDQDTFYVGPGEIHYSKDDPLLYTSTVSSVTAEQNGNAIYGMYSDDEYEYYSLTATQFSTDPANDNDCIIYTAIFHTDDLGVEHTLSLVTIAGGVSELPAAVWVDPNKDTESIFGAPTPNPTTVKAHLIYNYGKNDWNVIETFDTGETVTGWKTITDAVGVEGLDLEVARSGDDLEIICKDWVINGNTSNHTFNYNLNSNSYTEKLKGFNSFGFAFLSQPNATFKDVNLTVASGDYYGILRIDPKDSQSDNTITELSTLIEAPNDNLLTNINGLLKLSTLSWDGTSFVVQGLVDTSKVDANQEYEFSAELRLLNLLE